MRITKYGHACVRIEQDGRVLVVDPGVWTEPEAVTGADAVLITHEHADHNAQLNERGLASVNSWLGRETDNYQYLAPGESPR